ncbi:tRNA (adenosine(37)-N6)-threonylcarbamoyltransferase complex transferase subunit TsaD [candidate division KSB1 bacterium 4572_119]|nr:MAG: tRNA (adenosine(37)-N6)-threonylcarbamoyltransferase complex transferase subunit TsaD [candidate division KSB1 bacterium 4572_119]
MTILGIETSCDETAAAIYSSKGLLSNIVASQAVHEEFGGVVPELASREHIRAILPIIKQALKEARLDLKEIDGMAVTQGPGLAGSLLVGINTAKALAYTLKRPLIGINHIEGHIFAINLSHQVKPPFISLVISGGHTQLVLVKNFGEYQILGKTQDDAAGEAFDKVAKMMGLGYPGGPVIDRLATNGNENFVNFPRALLKSKNYNFSFSGLKTAVLYYLKSISEEQRKKDMVDIVASFQAALADVLIKKTMWAANENNIHQIVLAGGVARNNYLRARMKASAEKEKKHILIPEPIFCTDNAAMIAWVGYQKLKLGTQSPLSIAPIAGMKL